MANRIKGITIKIDGETTGLDKALKGVNSTIKTTQQELRDVTRLLKLDPSNTELVRQKQELLAKAVSETKTKLDTLKKAAQQMGDITENSTEQEIQQYNALQREIVDTESKLKKLTTQQKEFTAQHSALGQIGQKFQDVGSKIESVGQKLAGVSAAAGIAVAALTGVTVKAAATADELNTVAKQTGLSTDELQKFNYASELIDVSLSDIATGLKRTEKAMGSNSSVLSELNVKTKNLNGTYRKAEDVFFDVIDALGKVEDETQRDIYAQELFGKSFQNLNPLIEDGTEKLKALYEEAESSDLLLSQEEIDRANNLNDSIDRLKGTWELSMMKMGSSMAESLEPVIDRVTEKIETLSNWAAEHSGAATTIATILAVIAALAPLLIVIGKVITAIGTIATAMSTAGASISTVLGGIEVAGMAAAATFGVVALTIGTAIYAIAGVFIYWDEIVQNFKTEWGKFCTDTSIEWNDFTGKIETGVDNIVKWFADLPGRLQGYFKGLIKDAFGWGSDFMGGLAQGIQDGFDSVVDKVSALAAKIREYLHFSRPDIGPLREYEKWMPDMMKGLAKGINDNSYLLKDAVNNASAIMAEPLNKTVSIDSKVSSNNPFVKAIDSLINSVDGINTGMMLNNGNDQTINLRIDLGGAKVAEQIFRLNQKGKLIFQG